MELQHQVLVDLLQCIGKSSIVVDNDAGWTWEGNKRFALHVGYQYSTVQWSIAMIFVQYNIIVGMWLFFYVMECVLTIGVPHQSSPKSGTSTVAVRR